MSLFKGELPELRDFQITALEKLRQGARDGHRKQLIMAPTGSGKTIFSLDIAMKVTNRGGRAMFVCDRKTLVSQTSNVASEVGLGHHGIIQAQNPMMDLSRPFQIASVQTLGVRGWPQDMDVIIIDEAHTMYKTWLDYISSDKCKAMVIGLSATPFSPGMGRVFTNLINAATMHELTEQGILVPMRIFSGRKPDMKGAATKGGEWTEKAAEERELVIVGDVVTEWVRFAHSLKTIVFGSTIRHCEALRKQFNDAGIDAATFCADTPDDARARILQDFKLGAIKVLISVEALAKGFDVKDVGCICDCRPLRKSLSTAIQMWGRGLRTSPETGKTECLLLDFSGNILRFADDFSAVYFDGLDKLDDGEKLDNEVRKGEEKEPKTCSKCGYSPMGKRCVGCGFEPVVIDFVIQKPGVMKEIVLGGKTLAASKADLYAQLVTYTKRTSSPEKWKSRVFYLFLDITGTHPPKNFRVETAPSVEPSRNTVNKIRSLNIAFKHRRAS